MNRTFVALGQYAAAQGGPYKVLATTKIGG